MQGLKQNRSYTEEDRSRENFKMENSTNISVATHWQPLYWRNEFCIWTIASIQTGKIPVTVYHLGQGRWHNNAYKKHQQSTLQCLCVIEHRKRQTHTLQQSPGLHLPMESSVHHCPCQSCPWNKRQRHFDETHVNQLGHWTTTNIIINRLRRKYQTSMVLC